MKLLTFRIIHREEVHFGTVIGNYAVPFAALQDLNGTEWPFLSAMDSYLRSLPDSERAARELYQSGLEQFSRIGPESVYRFEHIQILPPVAKPASLLDFGLSPRHLLNSGQTLLSREFRWPLKPLLRLLLARAYRRERYQAAFRYYKGNHQEISGDGDTLAWPPYTSFLDIEPELGIVIGHTGIDSSRSKPLIAGYLIFNDVSARDVQYDDFRSLCGPGISKDFHRSNGLGPFLVTPDEVGDPLSLAVTVRIGSRWIWEGSTSEYTAHPQEVIDYIGSVFTLPPGTVVGMGTIPYCCGLDRNQWIRPGDRVSITFDKLGTLTQHVPSEPSGLLPSRWGIREELIPFYQQHDSTTDTGRDET
ncbi:fumarylacetoacetate hydrolase family protein [Paenibacillus dendritiformis]|uniref:fumarylacetoacetate hydrolase family protein n=1 Tax=Paenibacillus dendritiformis TaxID=130049 RepID=UPI00248CE1F4|nr:fumarylacetoacetate hydrolase family protein [Paenibacillus dendritiformis]WGU93242.1 fumarylacetoacetate hydrolase family protein [Paenibacillus dendritiformis]